MAENLGDRVRELRVARSMSQGDLARGLVSGSYISLIEAGKRLPEREVMQVLAERLGTSAEFLETGIDPVETREEELAIRYADIALANGQVAEALGRFKTIALTGRTFRHEAAWGLARCYEAQALLHEATQQVEWLLAETRASRSIVPGLLVLLTTQCRIYREGGDLNFAIELGEKGLAEVRALGLGGSDDELRLASTVVGCYWQRGDWMRAELLAEDVVRRAEANGSRRSRGSAYWNASVVAESQGKLALAVELAEKALALFAEGDDERAIAALRLNLGTMLLRRSPENASRARTLLERARESMASAGLETDLAYCDAELARVSLIEGDAKAARSLAEDAIRRLRDGSVIEAIRLHIVLALALLRLDDQPGAQLESEIAQRLLTQSGLTRRVAAAWRDLGDLHRSIGDTDAALRFYQSMADSAGIVGTALASVIVPGLSDVSHDRQSVLR